jgi:hypothetical protein
MNFFGAVSGTTDFVPAFNPDTGSRAGEVFGAAPGMFAV